VKVLLDVFLHLPEIDKPILILGKGPSIERFKEVALEEFFVICINDVGDKIPVDLSFFIHGESIPEDKPVLIPYYPHIGKKPGPLSPHSRQDAYHYNLCTGPSVNSPVITQDGFSIHALLNILGLLGNRDIYTVGIDGGSEYSTLFPGPKFDWNIFDYQWAEIERIKNKFGMKVEPLFKPFGTKAGHSMGIPQTVNE
jgi:hypothetical protein